MNNKKLLYIFLGIFAVAGALYIYQRTGNEKERYDAAKGKPIAGQGIFNDSFDTLTFTDSGNSFSVKKTDGIWVVAESEYPADSTLLYKLLENLNTQTITETASANPEIFDKFGFTEAGKQSGKKITFYKDGNTFAEFLIGNSREGGGQYIKRTDTDQVWLIKNAVTTYKNPGEFIEKNLKLLNRELIKGIDIKVGKNNYTYERQAPDSTTDSKINFKSVGKSSIDKAKFDEMLSGFETVRFIQVYKALPSLTDAKANEAETVFHIKTGGTLTLILYKQTADKVSKYYLAVKLNEVTDTFFDRINRFVNNKYFEISESDAGKMLLK